MDLCGGKIARLLEISAENPEVQGECPKSSELLQKKNGAQKSSQIHIGRILKALTA